MENELKLYRTIQENDIAECCFSGDIYDTVDCEVMSLQQYYFAPDEAARIRAEFNEIAQDWNTELKAVLDRTITTALSKCEMLIRNYFWILGMMDAVHNRQRSIAEVNAIKNFSGYADMKTQLRDAYDKFTEFISGRSINVLDRYIENAVEEIEQRKPLYYLHGIKFIHHSFAQAGMKVDEFCKENL